MQNLVFTRIDDRLIHGQVCAAWLKTLSSVRHILVIDDRTSQDPFMSEMFALLIPSHISIEIRSVEQATEKDNRLILQIIDYINAHLEQNICLDDLSARFFISKNSLCKKFRSVMRCSVAEYIMGARQTRAKNLLVTTDLSMDEIAERCGYSSANYVSLIFKKNVGLSPVNYRKKK